MPLFPGDEQATATVHEDTVRVISVGIPGPAPLAAGSLITGADEIIVGTGPGTATVIKNVVYANNPRFGGIDGSADDVTSINAAIDACYAAGGGRVDFPNVSTGYGIAQVGAVQSSGILPKPGVSYHSYGATFHMLDNCSFFYGKSEVDVTATISADVAMGDDTVTVSSAAGLVVGRNVMLRLNTNATNIAEPQFIMYAKITDITGTTITLDTPISVAMTVSGTSSGNRALVQFVELIENISFSGEWNFVNDMAGGHNAESGISLTYCRNVKMDVLRGTDTGAGVVTLQFCENVEIATIQVPEGVAQAGQASKGRAINFSNCHNVAVGSISNERSDGTFTIYIESYSRGIDIGKLHAVNNEAGRDALDKYAIGLAEFSQLHIGYARFSGLPARTMNVQDGSSLTIDDLDLQMTDIPVAGVDHMSVVQRSVRIGDLLYGPRTKVSKVFRVTPSMTNVSITPGVKGVMAGAWLEVSTTTGWTQWYWGSTAAENINVGDYTASVPHFIVISDGWGVSGYAPTTPSAVHVLYLYTDGTVPVGSYGILTHEYFPLSTESPRRLNEDYTDLYPIALAKAPLTVTGAKGGNAALTSLLTQLAALGLITDSSS